MEYAVRIVVEFPEQCAAADAFWNVSREISQSIAESAWDVAAVLLLARELVPALAPNAHCVAYEIDRIHFQLDWIMDRQVELKESMSILNFEIFVR